MGKLNLLKGTENIFGKISIKDDLTPGEREEIRVLAERAKLQTNQSDNKVYKVRGDRKNGWRLIFFQKK